MPSVGPEWSHVVISEKYKAVNEINYTLCCDSNKLATTSIPNESRQTVWLHICCN